MSVANLPTTRGQDNHAVPEAPIFRLTVDQYHEMIRAGILTENDPVELLEGWLVCTMSKNPPHSVATDLTAAALRNLSPSGWCIRSQEPITTRESEPEPDIVMARGNSRDYTDHHPGPENLALVVEVADASLEQDRRTKLRIYASAGIPEYWIVNLLQRRVEVYSRPTKDGRMDLYLEHRDYPAEESVAVIIEGQEIGRIAVASILP